MLRKPKLHLASMAVVALMAAIPATSSAAEFHWSSGSGLYQSMALGPQVLTFGHGPSSEYIAECEKAEGEEVLRWPDAHVFPLRVNYSNCNAFGFVEAEVSPVEYLYHADGRVDLLTPLTLTVHIPFATCSETLEPQSNLASVTYENSPGGTLRLNAEVKGLAYSHGGSGLCPPGGSDGTLTGANLLYNNAPSWSE